MAREMQGIVSPFGDIKLFDITPKEAATLMWERGYRIIPIRLANGKKIPIVKSWKPYNVSLEQVQKDVGSTKAFAIVVPKGLVVIDLDTTKGEDTSYVGLDNLATLAFDYGITDLSFMNTLTVITPSLGDHLYYRIPSTLKLKNSASQLCEGVDVRVPEDGLVLVPPSMGENGRAYIFTPNQAALRLPTWLNKALLESKEKTREQGQAMRKLDMSLLVADKNQASYIERRCQGVASAMKGNRNHSLNATAYGLFRRVYGGYIEEFAASEALHNAGLLAGLTEREITATIGSAKKAAQRKPMIL